MNADNNSKFVISNVSESGVYVTGGVNHRSTCVLLDTGATVCVLNENTWKKCGSVDFLHPVHGILTTANGKGLEVLGETKVRFRFGNCDFLWPVVIVRDLAHECILGSDFFQHFGCQIHYNTGTFVIQGDDVPIRYVKKSPSVCRVFLNTNVKLEPGTELIVNARIEEGFDHNMGSPGILEQSKELRQGTEVCMARTMVVPRDGFISVCLANFTDRSLYIESDFPVAEYYPISQVYGPLNLNEHKWNSCATIDVRDWEVSCKQKGNEKLQARLKQDVQGLSECETRGFMSLMDKFDVFANGSHDLGKTNLMEHEINTGNSLQIKRPPRRTPPSQREIIDHQLK